MLLTGRLTFGVCDETRLKSFATSLDFPLVGKGRMRCMIADLQTTPLHSVSWPAFGRSCWRSVRKVVSRSKFTEQIFTPQAEHNFQMCAQIIFILRVAEQFM